MSTHMENTTEQAMSEAKHTLERTKAECDLASTQDSINGLSMHLRVLVRRFAALERLPEGRGQLLPEQRVEYDIIGATLSRLPREIAAIAKATGSAQ